MCVNCISSSPGHAASTVSLTLSLSLCLSLSRHSSLSSISSGRSSRLHPVSVPSFWRIVLVDRPTLARPCVGVHRRTSCMSCSSYLNVLEMGSRWPYNSCFVACCFQDLLIIARSILAQFLSCFFSIRSVSVHAVHPYSSIDTTAAWKKLRFFYRISLTSLWSITYRKKSMPWLVAYWCHFP